MKTISHNDEKWRSASYVVMLMMRGFFKCFSSVRGGLREASGSEIGVLGFLVSAQIDFSLKGSAAQVARERLVTRVLPAVSDQI